MERAFQGRSVEALVKPQSGALESAQQIELRTARSLAALSVMEEEFRQEMEPGQKVRWCQWLTQYPIETIEAAAERCIKENPEFFPKYAEFTEVIKTIMAEEIAKRLKPKADCPDCGGTGMKPCPPPNNPYRVTTCKCKETPQDFKERASGE